MTSVKVNFEKINFWTKVSFELSSDTCYEFKLRLKNGMEKGKEILVQKREISLKIKVYTSCLLMRMIIKNHSYIQHHLLLLHYHYNNHEAITS